MAGLGLSIEDLQKWESGIMRPGPTIASAPKKDKPVTEFAEAVATPLSLSPTGIGQAAATAVSAAPFLAGEKSFKELLSSLSEVVLGVVGNKAVPAVKKVWGGQSATGYMDAVRSKQVFRPAAPLADGKVRFEIPDTAAKVKLENFTPFNFDGTPGRIGAEGTLKELLDHPELFKNYPFLERTKVTLVLDPNLGTVATGYHRNDINEIVLQAENKDALISTLMHEIQHAIQIKEGFNTGGSANTISDVIAGKYSGAQVNLKKPGEIYSDSDIKSGSLLESQLKRVGRLKPGSDPLSQNYLQYLHLAGEQEARQVGERALMTPEQLLATPPWRHPGDVNQDKLIFTIYK
jgi:hypothetical protein